MNGNWLDHILDAIADRGRDLIRIFPESKTPGSLSELCAALLATRGEASGIALSREILRRYRDMGMEQKKDFFDLLLHEYGADPDKVRATAEAYLESHSHADFQQLYDAVEPPRQELLRHLNMAPNATAQLVAMRGDLLNFARTDKQLYAVDADFRHLLASWFNRGFLQLQVIDWYTPAYILEKLINYESVHAIRSWDDLRRRLASDRRCFAFFHPAMHDEPLIFVEVALVKGMTSHVQILLDDNAPVLDVRDADTAVFYSINNTQLGLRGISFGNFLIKQVLEELGSECPWIRKFVTLSPMPRFADTIKAAIRGEVHGLGPERIESLLSEWGADLMDAAGKETAGLSFLSLVEDRKMSHTTLLSKPLEQLVLAYLIQQKGNQGVIDPVATFHLSNGARLERINTYADDSEERHATSFGCMVNYLYEPDEVEANHEAFVTRGEIAMSKALGKQYKKILAIPGLKPANA